MTAPATPGIPRLDVSSSPDDIRSAMDEAGCCVIEDAASPEIMDQVAADMAPFVEATRRGDSDFAGTGTRRTGLVITRSPTFRQHLARHDAILIAGDHLLHHSTAWNLSFAHYFELFPGEPTQLLHRDTWKYGAPPFPEEVDFNGLWAVSEFTEANGATRMVPGSHRWAPDRRPDPAESVPAIAPKGSLVLYTGLIFHGGGANTSPDQVRLAVNVQHAAGWLCQTERLLLECPPSLVAEWEDDLIRFIGYQLSGPALGHWRNAEDPMAAVDEFRSQNTDG